MSKIITGKNINKTFHTGDEAERVLHSVSLEIEQGEFVAVMGPSGSGKTTLMFILSGMDTMDDGEVLFEGRKLAKLSERELADLRRRKMGFVFQQPTFLKNLNLLDNIVLPAQRDNRKKALTLTFKGKNLMQKVGIAGLENRDITQVSGGQLQRAGICRALMGDPKIIFADEPTGALNSKSADEIMEIFSQINEEGTAVMVVTHDAKIAARAQRVVFMHDGEIAREISFPKEGHPQRESRIQKILTVMREIGI